jgi:serine protease Do
MKKLIFSCALLGTMQFVNAQTMRSEEKIILQDNKPSTEVQIEIKDGDIYVDGKKVSPYSVNKNLKIIKKFGKVLNNGDMPDIDITIDKEVFGGDTQADNKPMLGVSTEPSKTNDGALVNAVNANTPAAKAGLQDGDVITKINKTAITSPQDLVTAIGNYKPGEEVTIYFTRDNKEMSKQATLAARDNDRMGQLFGGPDGQDMMGSLQQMMKRFGDFGDGNNPFEGMEEMGGDGNVKIFGKGMTVPKTGNNNIGLQVQERADNQGVLVTTVKENSPAAKAGIKADDVITIINGTNIASIDDISKVIAKLGNAKELVTEVMRAGKKQIVTIVVEKQLRKKEF